MKVKRESEVSQPCLTLRDHMEDVSTKKELGEYLMHMN